MVNYPMEDVKHFIIYDKMDAIQIKLYFDDENFTEMSGPSQTYSKLYEKSYYSEYNYIADYIVRLHPLDKSGYWKDVSFSFRCGAAAFGRLGAFVAPLIVPVIYEIYGKENGYSYIFVMFAAVFATVATFVGIFGKETMGKSLEEISGDVEV